MKTARDFLCDLYCDYRNNYLTVARFSEHNGLLEKEGEALIALARDVFNHEHPEA